MSCEKELRRAINHARKTGDGELYQDLEAQLAELEAEKRAQLPKPTYLWPETETRGFASSRPSIQNLRRSNG